MRGMPRAAQAPPPPRLTFAPLTPERWPDLVRLFGPRGACAGCWCMWWRLTRPRYEAGKRGGNREAFQAYVEGGRVPGLLAYEGAAPVAWVAVEPRSAYPRVLRSRTLAPPPARADDPGAWAISCFFVAKSHRGRGLMRPLIAAATAHAKAAGASTVEAYPVDYAKAVGDSFVYTGALSAFVAEGFAVARQPSATRPVVERRLSGRRAPAGRARARARSTPRSSRTPGSGSRRGR